MKVHEPSTRVFFFNFERFEIFKGKVLQKRAKKGNSHYLNL